MHFNAIYRICYSMCNTTGATCETGSAYPSGASEITPSFWWGSCCLFFSFLCCVMCIVVCLFVFFIFSHGVVSLFSIYQFDCTSGIFRPSFKSWFDKPFMKWFPRSDRYTYFLKDNIL